jgi:uncharacterized protein
MIGRDQNDNRRPFRQALKLMSIGGGVLAAGAAYSSFIEPRTILHRQIDLAIPTLPQQLDGLKIAFLSDFHLGGPGDPLGTISRVLTVLNEHAPDLILLGGDYYDRGMRVHDEPDWRCFPEIAPTLAVPGNHDYLRGRETTERIFETLATAGITVLRNEVRDFPLHGSHIRVIGVDDPYTGRDEFLKATSTATGDFHPRILLAHSGLIADQLPPGSADLILTGHTHGAQIRFSPFRYTLPLDAFWWLDLIKNQPRSPYRQGLFRVRGSLLYVGNGLGTTWLGMRFLAPPEVATFRLRTGTGWEHKSCDNPSRYELRNANHWITRFPLNKATNKL